MNNEYLCGVIKKSDFWGIKYILYDVVFKSVVKNEMVTCTLTHHRYDL